MDVDRFTLSLRQSEHDAQMSVDIAIETGRIEPTHHIGAQFQRLFHHLRGAWRGENAVLRKRHELNLDPIPVPFSHPEHRFERPQPRDGIHLDVASQRRGAARDHVIEQHLGPSRRWQRGGQILVLNADPFRDRGARPEGEPAIAKQRRIEVDVAIDQTREHQRATEILDPPRHRRLARIANRYDPMSFDRNRDRLSPRESPVVQQQIERHPLHLASRIADSRDG